MFNAVINIYKMFSAVFKQNYEVWRKQNNKSIYFNQPCWMANLDMEKLVNCSLLLWTVSSERENYDKDHYINWSLYFVSLFTNIFLLGESLLLLCILKGYTVSYVKPRFADPGGILSGVPKLLVSKSTRVTSKSTCKFWFGLRWLLFYCFI